MRAYLVKTIIGVFALDESKKVLSFKPFSKNPSEIADKLLEREPTEYEQIKHELKGFNFIIDDKEIENFIKENLRKYAIHYNFVKDQVEFNQFLANVSLEISKRKIKEAASRDNLIIHVNNAMEELDKTLNIFIERLRELYGLHFPEMDRTISDNKQFAEIICKFGSREKIENVELKQFAEKSIGMDFKTEDIKTVQTFANEIIRLYNLRDELSKYLEKILKEIAPNFTELAGTILAAKLISKAGGLEKLARVPASFIQLLGSEKSLFHYLHGKGKSPKFGFLFLHPLIQNAPEKYRGKIVRVLASKLSIAVKTDFYTRKNRAEQLKNELKKRVEEILRG